MLLLRLWLMAAFAAPPTLNLPPEEGEKRFNLSRREGEPADSFARALKHLYYNLAGEGAIRDGIAHQEKAILAQAGGRPDPAQGAVYAAILRCDASLARLYRVLRGVALALEKEDTEARRAEISSGMSEAEALLRPLSSLVEDAGRWHAAAYRAAGGSGPADLTGQALGNGAASAAAAMTEARAAVKRAKGQEAASLPDLPDYHARLAIGELPANPAPGRRRVSIDGGEPFLRRLGAIVYSWGD